MNLTPQPSTEIALNVTRTRVTVLMFNLTIIAFMITLLGLPAYFRPGSEGR
jgi:hypothetical protein